MRSGSGVRVTCARVESLEEGACSLTVSLASKLLEQPELVQQLAVAMAGGHKAIRQFLENLGILGE